MSKPKKQTKAKLAKKQRQLEKREKKEKLRDWKIFVNQRDNYADQISGEDLKNNPKNCHAHHIFDKKNFPELMFDINNGITLNYWNHKVGPWSPHMNSIIFARWFKTKFPDRYVYLIELIKKHHPDVPECEFST